MEIQKRTKEKKWRNEDGKDYFCNSSGIDCSNGTYFMGKYYCSNHKKVVAWDNFPVQVWVMIVAVVSTVVAAAALAQYFGIVMLWYYWLAAVVVGLLVCYAAMFGYDNLYKQINETLQKIRELLAGTTKEE